MINKYEEIYAKNKCDITQLVQDWIDENISEFYCNNSETELKYNQIDR